MNFWLLTTEYPPQSGGGISTYCFHTAKMLAQNGHQVSVFVPNHHMKTVKYLQQEELIRVVSYPIIQYDFLGYEAGLSYNLSFVLENEAKINGEPDYIESQEYNGLAYYALQRKWLEKNYLSKPVFFVTAHAPGYLYLDYNQAPTHAFPEYWIGEMEKAVLAMADFVISPSQYLLDKLALKKPPSELHVVHNPYHLQELHGISHKPHDIVFFGKLTPQKGAIEMLKYFEKAWEQGIKIPLSVIGGGDHYFYPLMEDMGTYFQKKYKHRIDEGLLKFEGHILPENLHDRLAKAHVVIVPSIVDNLPYTVVEAMFMGKVVLASTDGGHKELLVHGKTGFLFEHTIEDDFINQLNIILNLSDKELTQIGENARKAILEKCGYESVYDKKIKILSSYQKTQPSKFPFIRPIQRKYELKNTGELGKLSVVIPYFNMGKYVEETITSVVNNNYDNYEIIIVNDGSTDELSLSKLDELKANNKNLLVYHKPNTGLCDTRNFGAQKATGEFMAFLDPDDTIEPTYYKRATDILRKYDNVSFVGCWAQYFGAKDYVWPSFNPEPPFLLTHNMVNSSGIVAKKDHFITYGLNDRDFLYGMEDYDSVISMVKNGCGGVVLPQCLWNYRIRKGSLAQSFNKYSKNYLYRLIAKKHADFFSVYVEDVVNLLNSNGPGMNFDNPSKPLGAFHGINLPFKDSKWLNFVRTNKFLRKIAKSIFKTLNQ